MPTSSSIGRTLLPAVTHPVPGRARNQHDARCAGLAGDGRAEWVPPLRRDLNHALTGILGRLLYSHRHFIGFAVADADAAVPISSDNQCAKAESAATFDHLGTAIDANDGRLNATLFGLTLTIAPGPKPALLLATATAMLAGAGCLGGCRGFRRRLGGGHLCVLGLGRLGRLCNLLVFLLLLLAHNSFSPGPLGRPDSYLEAQAAFARRVGKGLDPPRDTDGRCGQMRQQP